MRHTRSRRRLGQAIVIAVVAAAVVIGHWITSASLDTTPDVTGWVLGGVVLILAAYNIRKKMPFLPLGSSATWLRLHVAVGLISGVIFLTHLSFAMPQGWFDVVLATAFAATFLSGVLGLVLSRLLPPRLLARGESFMLERIPRARRVVRLQAEAIALEAAERGADAIADFFDRRLLTFFAEPRHLWSHLAGSQRPRQRLLEELVSLERYERATGRASLEEMGELVRVKDDLDARHAGLSVLRWWLFVHIPLTAALLVLIAVHLVLVRGFSGGGA